MRVRLLMDNLTVVHKQDGGHKIPTFCTPSIRSMGVVPLPQYPHRGSVFTKGTKYPSRPRISSIFRSARLETRPLDVCGTKSGLGFFRGRAVCLSALNSTSTVLQLETRSSFRGSGCIFSGLEQGGGICIPSLCSSRPLPQTVTRLECVTPRSSCTGLAVLAMYPLLLELSVASDDDSDDDFRSGCRNVGHCHQQQSFSGLLSPGRSNHTND